MKSKNSRWQNCEKILIVRLDNLGDVLMSTPAIRAVKKTFGCSITLLTSSMAAALAPSLEDVDDVIVADVPWVKSDKPSIPADWTALVEKISAHHFDGAIIFTVFSQNPMPAILLTWLAQIPNRLAYCRENPYHLLTDWMPEQEPYTIVRHQVERDLHLVAAIGAETSNPSLSVTVPRHAYGMIRHKLQKEEIDTARPWIIVHPGASESKREYPIHLFKTIVQKLIRELDVQVVVTGTEKEKQLIDQLCEYVNSSCCKSLAGRFTLQEFMALIDIAPLVLSVNTGTVHLAAALNTPVVVLYANTNPQHTPWKVPHDVFLFPVLQELRSKNEVLRFIQEKMTEDSGMPDPDAVVASVSRLLQTTSARPV